jgi:AcrR family transcriptional regulator
VPQAKARESTPPAGGRQRLIEAALRLAARRSSVASLGLRELAREAGLNPNTFYRHFKDLDELSIALVDEFGQELQRRRQESRRVTTDFITFLSHSLKTYFEFAAEHPEAFLLGFRELASASATGRAVKKLMDEVAHDLNDIARQFGDLELPEARRLELASFIVSGLFLQAIEYIEHKSQRRTILKRAERYVALLLHGALAMNALEQSSANAKQA